MKSNISNIFFTIVFAVMLSSVLFLIFERLLQIDAAALISFKYLTLPFIAISFLVHKKENYEKSWSYIFDKIKIVLLCLLLATPCLIAFNKFIGESKNAFISGEVVKTKPGRGTREGRWQEIELNTNKGLVTLNIAHYLFVANTKGKVFSIECKVGSLGLYYL